MPKVTLYGFNGSTYVRTVKMLFVEKGFTDFEQVSVNVLKGEPNTPEHLKRHPFGKVPVLEWDGSTILETTAITRFLNDKLPGRSLVPATAEDRARMDMTIGLIDSYGYGALIGGVAAFHLFPDFVGGRNDSMRQKGIEDGRKLLQLLMELRGSGPFIAGDLSLADLFLAPIMAYVTMTPDSGTVSDVPGLSEWWDKINALPCFQNTPPG